MSHAYTFEDFLKNKKKEDSKNKIDWTKRKKDWLSTIDDFYSEIRIWLKEFEDNGYLKIEMNKSLEISEEYIGTYKVGRLDIYIGNDIISLIPKGALIYGSTGRIDIRGPKGEIMMIRNEDNKWQFAKRTPKLEMWDVTDESFKSIIQELV